MGVLIAKGLARPSACLEVPLELVRSDALLTCGPYGTKSGGGRYTPPLSTLTNCAEVLDAEVRLDALADALLVLLLMMVPLSPPSIERDVPLTNFDCCGIGICMRRWSATHSDGIVLSVDNRRPVRLLAQPTGAPAAPENRLINTKTKTHSTTTVNDPISPRCLVQHPPIKA